MSTKKVALITGANRGIGFEIGSISKRDQRLPFKGTPGYSLELLLVIPKSVSANLIESRSGLVLLD